jgi:hypothetical protein
LSLTGQITLNSRIQLTEEVLKQHGESKVKEEDLNENMINYSEIKDSIPKADLPEPLNINNMKTDHIDSSKIKKIREY